MSLSLVYTRAQQGIKSPLVTVETHISNGAPIFSIVGLPEAAVKESKDRVRSAIINSKFEFPIRRITVNLGPADLPKEGGRYDLAIALGILAATRQIPSKELDQYEFISELALSGDLKPVKGILPSSMAIKDSERSLVVAVENGEEAIFIDSVKILVAHNLDQICRHLQKELRLEPYISNKKHIPNNKFLDLKDIKGQFQAKRALTIAAAGGHSLLFFGPPGSGKTLLANRLLGLLPDLNDQQAKEVAAIQSISQQGLTIENLMQRPFRAPHHTASHVALVGGGRNPTPGEISLAHHGILFLDELPEFDRKVLEVLREPLESGRIVISRAAEKVEYPAKFQLIAAMNPCPCGHLGDERIPCRCTELQIKRYRQKLSGPLLDRLDMHVAVKSLASRDLINDNLHSDNPEPPSESFLESVNVKQQVYLCQQLQLSRQQMLNAELEHRALEKICGLNSMTRSFMQQAMDKLGFSARIFHRILKLGRTIADLASEPEVTVNHLSEAMAFRGLDRMRFEQN
ncbi:MAG: YifB family Mg chelatase-like AAA ATPase [Gammaproteobacteria bacterium]|nr:YifB family Mg chelatase-like AAA ATPase [Gammaproteobacteria bacterium]